MEKNEIDTGIWQISRPTFTDASDFFSHMKQRILETPNPHDLSTICGDAEQFARFFIDMNERGEWFESEQDLRCKRHSRAEAVRQMCERKKHILEVATKMLHQTESMREAIQKGDAKRAAVLGFWLGNNYKTLRILPHEHISAAAKRSRAGAKKIAQRRSKKAKESKPNFQKLVAEQMDLQRRSRGKLVLKAALAKVAAKSDVSIDVVRRNVRNIWTARPRKKK